MVLTLSLRGRSRRARVFHLCAAVCIGLGGGCFRSSGDQGDPAKSEVTTVRGALTSAMLTASMPAGTGLNTVALGATQSLRISDRAKAIASPGYAGVASTGATETHIGVDTKVGHVSSVGSVFLRERARVTGAVRTTGTITKQNGVVITGGEQVGVTLTPPVTVAQKVDFAGGADINREPGQPAISLTPGSYGHVTIKSRSALQLSAGRYTFESASFEPDAELRLNTTAGAVVLLVRTNFVFKGKQVHTGSPANVFLGVLGSQASLETVFNGTVVAPNATLRFAPAFKTFKGAFFGRAIEVEPDLTIEHVPFAHWGSVVDVQNCAEAIQPRMDLTGRAREVAFQRDIARFCTMPGTPQCMADLTARANVDYTLAAGALLTQQLTPAQYLSVVRDRTRKLRAAEDDPAIANRNCTRGDADGDGVPDGTDVCPNTPELTATDDVGCPITTLPPGPDPGHVRDYLQNSGFISNLACSNALLLPKIPAGAFYYPGIPANGTFILSGRVTNQPPNCHVWYFFDIQEESVTGAVVRKYNVAFMDTEEATALVGQPMPVPSTVIQFNPRPGDAGTRAFLATAGGKNVRFRVQAMNGGGMRSGWSEWKLTTNDDCTALGFTCVGQ